VFSHTLRSSAPLLQIELLKECDTFLPENARKKLQDKGKNLSFLFLQEAHYFVEKKSPKSRVSKIFPKSKKLRSELNL